jgi:spore germination protein KA
MEDLASIKTIFDRFSDIVYREFTIGGGQESVIIFLDGLVNMKLVDSDILHPLMNADKISEPHNHPKRMIQVLQDQLISAASLSWGEKIDDIVNHVLSGDTVLLVDGMNQALLVSVRDEEKRAISEPVTEPAIRGPRDGFTEVLRTNTSLIRRRLKTPQLKMEAMQVGRLSKTEIVLTYLDGIAADSLVAEVKERISKIKIDAILESGYIEEFILDSPYSIFPQLQYTERPDKVTAYLLEGHVGILVDNTPFVLIAPSTFFQFIQASEDYYQNYIVASFTRWIRYLFLIISLMLPSLYIAVLTFHQEMMPSKLLLSMASSRETIPFPTLIEVFVMEIIFEGLREAGVRLPRLAGSAVSIVGAIVIGQVAIQANIVSAPTVIIVSTTGIASFVIPSFNQSTAIRLLRFPLMMISGFLGLYGILLMLLVILIHMARLRSFGVPYLAPMAPMHTQGLQDVLIRSPWWLMIKRPKEIAKGNRHHMEEGQKPHPPNKSEK